jgi:hypothetical protein
VAEIANIFLFIFVRMEMRIFFVMIAAFLFLIDLENIIDVVQRPLIVLKLGINAILDDVVSIQLRLHLI